MKILLNVLLLAHAALAQPARIQVLLAPRYQGRVYDELRVLLDELGTLRSPGAFEMIDVDRHRPILGGEDSLIAEVRRRVLSASVEEKLNLHVVVDSHGSPTAIHSQECDPAPYAGFATEWRSLMAELLDRGYRPENLTFDLILHFCYSGNLKAQLGPTLPFDTLIINSAQSDHIAITSVIRDMFKRVAPAYVAAKTYGIGLCDTCGRQELLYLLLHHIYRIDLSTGRYADDTALPPPEVEWWVASIRDKDAHVPRLARNLFDLYARALADQQTHKRFINTFRYTVNEYAADPLARAVRALGNHLSFGDKPFYDQLFFHSRFDSGLTPSEVTRHFDLMRASPFQYVRDAAIHDLLMLGDMVPDMEELLAKQADLELAQTPRDPARLQLHRQYLEGLTSSAAVDACQRLLDALGR
jgi:hypothetical protein